LTKFFGQKVSWEKYLPKVSLPVSRYY